MILLSNGLIFSAVLLVIGFTGLILCRNFLFMLIGLEVMINASALAFIIADNYWNQVDGQIMYILTITLSAVEASIGLALLLQLQRRLSTLDIDVISEMNG